MRTIVALLALLSVLSVQAQSVPSYRVQTLDDLLDIRINVQSIPVAWVASRSTNYIGGGGSFFYNGSSTAPTNAGTIFKPINGEGRWIRAYDNLETDFFGRTTEALNEALAFAERAKVEFPRNVDLFITAPLRPKSYSMLIGNGARLLNGATNQSGLVLMIIDRTIGTEVYGLRFDHQLGSHWNTGHMSVRGSTNTYIHHNEFQRAGYLTSILVQDADDGTHSEAPRIHENYIGDQIYGGASISAANLSVAESTRDAYVWNNRIVYSTLGNLNLSWLPLGGGHPNYPRLCVSYDRAFNAKFVDNEVINASGATNLVGFMLEDNSGATNILNRVRGNTFSRVEIGTQIVQLRGAASFTENVFDQCTGVGLEISQTVPADAHQLSFVTVSDNLFLNCNANPIMGQTGTAVWRNDAGQVRYVASLPYRMTFQNNQILSWSTNVNSTAFLYGGGHLSFTGNRIEQLGNTNAYGLRSADPIGLSETQPNAMYQATARNRKPLVVSKNQFVGYAAGKALSGVSDNYGDSTLDSYGNRTQWGTFRKRFATNLVSKLFQVHTVEANQTSIGNSGSWTAFIFLTVSNQHLDDYTLGNIGSHGRIFSVTHSVTENSPPVTANSVDQIFAGTQAKTGARGYTGLAMTAVSTAYHTTEIRLSFAGEGDVTDGSVYGTVMLVSSDMYMLPQIQE